MDVTRKFSDLLNQKAIAAGYIGRLAANKTIEQSEFIQAFIVNGNAMNYTIEPEDPGALMKAFIASTSAYLSQVKVSKSTEAVVLVLTDTAGGFKFAGIVEYHENEDDPNEPGNWSYTMTFNDSDVSDLEKTKAVKKFLYGGTQFKAVMNKVAYDVALIDFISESFMYDACLLCVDTLLQVLDREAKADETVTITMPGYFEAAVAVEGDEKIFSIVPDGHQKEVIKNDLVLYD